MQSDDEIDYFQSSDSEDPNEKNSDFTILQKR